MPTPIVNVGGLVQFDGTGDVWLTRAGKQAASNDPDRLLVALRSASNHSDNQLLNAAANGHGPFAAYGELSLEEFVHLLDEPTE